MQRVETERARRTPPVKPVNAFYLIQPVDCQRLRAVGSSTYDAATRATILYGTLGLMVVKTLEALGPLRRYLIARRIEQISGNQLALNQRHVVSRALLKLEQAGWISSKWGTSESGRPA